MARKNARPFGPNESLNGDAGSATEVYVASTRTLAAILSPLVAHWMGGGQLAAHPLPRENPAGINGSRLGGLSRGPAADAFAPGEGYTSRHCKAAVYIASTSYKKKSLRTVSKSALLRRRTNRGRCGYEYGRGAPPFGYPTPGARPFVPGRVPRTWSVGARRIARATAFGRATGSFPPRRLPTETSLAEKRGDVSRERVRVRKQNEGKLSRGILSVEDLK